MNLAYDTKCSSEEMIVEHLPLVKQIVDQMNVKNKHEFDRDDLVSIGVLGLIDAINRYDHEKKIPFSYYAKWRIRGTIIDELRKNGRVSRDRIKRLRLLNEARNELQQKLLREPSNKEICEHLLITPKELYEIEDVIHYLSQYSLDEVLFAGEEREFQLIDIIEDKKIKSPEDEFIQREKEERLVEAIEKLNIREQIILNLYYNEELTLKEIGEILNISLSRVSQIHGRILLKLRKLLSPIRKW